MKATTRRPSWWTAWDGTGRGGAAAEQHEDIYDGGQTWTVDFVNRRERCKKCVERARERERAHKTSEKG